MRNTLEVVERSDSRFEVKVTRCLCHELTTSVGSPELTPVVCQIDNAGFNSYLTDDVLFSPLRRGPANFRRSERVQLRLERTSRARGASSA